MDTYKCYHSENYYLFCSLPTCKNYGPCCFNCLKKYHKCHIDDCYCLGTLKIQNQNYKINEINEIIEKYISELNDYLNSITTIIKDKILLLENYKDCSVTNSEDITKYDLWNKLTKIDDENFMITYENVILKIKEKYFDICKSIYNYNKNYNKFTIEGIANVSLINNFNENNSIEGGQKSTEIVFSPKFDCELISLYVGEIIGKNNNNENNKNNKNNIFSNSINSNVNFFGNNNNFNNNNIFQNSLFANKNKISLFEENNQIFELEIFKEKLSEYKLEKKINLLKNKKYKLTAYINYDYKGYYFYSNQKNSFFNYFNNDKENFIQPFSLLKVKINNCFYLLNYDNVIDKNV